MHCIVKKFLPHEIFPPTFCLIFFRSLMNHMRQRNKTDSDDVVLGVANHLTLGVPDEGFTETEQTKLDNYVFMCNTMSRTLAERTPGYT